MLSFYVRDKSKEKSVINVKENEDKEPLMELKELKYVDNKKYLNTFNSVLTHSLGSVSIAAEEMSIENIIHLLKNPSNERSSKDIAILSKALENSDLMKKLKHNNRDVTELYQMVYFCSMHIKYSYVDKGKNVFQHGDKGGRFYIILRGSIEVLKPSAIIERMSAMDYLIYIRTLHEKKERSLIRMALESNKNTYPINIKDTSDLNKIIFKIFYRRGLTKQFRLTELKNLFKEFDMPTEFLSIKDTDFNRINELNENEINNLYQNELSLLISEFSSAKYELYAYVLEDSIKLVTIYTMNQFMTMSAGQFFGDLALDDDRERSATIKTLENTDFFFMESAIYKEYIASQKKRFVSKEIMFLLDNYFFSHIKKENFEINYFPSFIYEEYSKGEILLKENDTIKYIYFIKEGEVEISCNKNILEIHQIIKILLSLKIDHHLVVKDTYNFQNKPKNFLDDLKKHAKYKLFFYGSNEVVAVEHLYFNLSPLFQAKVTSDKIKLYKIDVKDFQMLIEEKSCLTNYERLAKSKITLLANRFIEIKNISLKFLDEAIFRREITSKITQVKETKGEEPENKNNELKSKSDKILKKVLTINYSLEQIDTKLKKSVLDKQGKFEKLRNLKNSNLDLPFILSKSSNMIQKKESRICFDSVQIESLKNEIIKFDQISIANFWKTPNNKNISLESGADYYIKTNNSDIKFQKKFSLNNILQTSDYLSTDYSNHNETLFNSTKSLKGDRFMKANERLKRKKYTLNSSINFNKDLPKFRSENQIIRIKGNFRLDSLESLSKKSDVSHLRLNTEEISYTDPIDSMKTYRTIMNEDSSLFKTKQLNFDQTGIKSTPNRLSKFSVRNFNQNEI